MELVTPLIIVDYRQGLAAIDEAQRAQSTSRSPLLAGLIDVYRSFFGMYLFGWTQELMNVFQAALPGLEALADVRVRSRVAWMEAAALAFAGDYSAAIRRAEESRQNSRKSGVFFEYFIATLFLNGRISIAVTSDGPFASSKRMRNWRSATAVRCRFSG